MRFKAKKEFGKSKTTACPFCARTATHKNAQGLEVCHRYLQQKMEEIKCACGSWLEQKSGPFGPYFNCLNCGNLNLKKALEIKEITSLSDNSKDFDQPDLQENKKEKKEITITSEDIEYFS